MKLIVTIPAFNEEGTLAQVIREIPRAMPGISQVEVLVLDDGSTDKTVEVARQAGANHIFSHKRNKGLAQTFKDALDCAVRLGADIIVNTDADNHYDQSRIPELIQPILKKQADITIGSRKVDELEHMPFLNKYLNRLGSFVMTKWAGIPKLDVSTGFRAYTQEAALRLGVYSTHTYSHTTLLSAQDLKLVTVEVPIKARQVTRQSRLITSIPNHLLKASVNIIRNIVIFRPLRFFGILGIAIFGVGLVVVGRFVYFYAIGDGSGHVQSLILAGVLMIIGFQTVVLGLIGSSIGWTRKVVEEALYRSKRIELLLEEQRKKA